MGRNKYAVAAMQYKQFNWMKQRTFGSAKKIDFTNSKFFIVWKKPTYYLIEWFIVKDLWDTCEIRCMNMKTKEVKQLELSKSLLKINDSAVDDSIYLI